MSNSSQPLTSVIIRTIGRPELKAAINSVLQQTYNHIEIIVVNANCRDNIGQFYAERPIIRSIISNEPLKRSAAANTGLANACGEFIIFLDDDDLFEVDHIEKLAVALAENPRAVAAYSGVRCSTFNHGIEESPPLRIFNYPFNPARLLYENYIPIHALLFRSESCGENGNCRFDENIDIFEDWDFFLQIMQKGEFIHINEITAIYRIHDMGGQGVRAESTKAIDALDYMLNKWRYLWTKTQVRDMVAYTRLINNLLETHKRLLQERLTEINLSPTVIQPLDMIDRYIPDISQLQVDLHKAQVRNNDLELNLQKSELNLHESKALTARLNQFIQDDKARLKEMEQNNASNIQIINSIQQELMVAKGEIGSYLIEISKLKSSQWYHIHIKMNAIKRKIRTVIYLLKEGRFKEFIDKIYENAFRLFAIKKKYGLRAEEIRKHDPMNMKLIEGTNSNMMANPLISIIIPVYQHAKFLNECIESAINQTYSNIEIIIIDDHSPDSAVQDILQEYRHHPNVRLFLNSKNEGISATQNRALLESRGQIIAFLDCDDYLAPEAVSSSISHWKENTIYTHSARVNIDENGREINRICFQQLPRKDYFSENLTSMYATHFKMIRRDVFSRLGLFDPRFDYAQDYDFLMRAAAHYPTESFSYIPQFLYFHRLHGNQNTEIQNCRQQEAVTMIKKEAILRKQIQAGNFDKKISFIMLSFGKQNQTLEAIKSIKRTVKIPHEIILLDNGSEPSTVEFIKINIEDKFEDTIVIYHHINLGPAVGRRVALGYASGDWFIIFDNDEVAEQGWIEELLIRGLSDPQIGAVTCKVIFPNRKLQCCGGTITRIDEDLVKLDLIGSGMDAYDLNTAIFTDCDWCPIGATLFTTNPSRFLHSGYPNVFEDAGVSMAMRKLGYRLINSPASWVWHNHMLFEKEIDMGDRYKEERYDPSRMLISVASFYKENSLIIYDEYIWRENNLNKSDLNEIRKLLDDVSNKSFPGMVY
jgi:glycosyltransferase involved in cell wall biosynthesis